MDAAPTDSFTVSICPDTSATTTESPGGIPGFTVGVALVALLAAAILVSRRD